MRSTGVMVPSTFDIWVIDTSFVRPPRIAANSSIRNSPSSLTGATRSTTPNSSRRNCQGMMLEWCSISEMTISSPGFRNFRPQDAATRLIASVALRVNTISRPRAAFRKARTVSRAASMRSVQIWLR